jgi:hypothetical protein
MSPTERPLVYALLGASGTGRRELLADLIIDGLAPSDQPVVLLAETEKEDPRDARLGTVVRWRWEGTILAAPEIPEGTTHLFFVADGKGNPVDQIEALKPWVASIGGEMARIYTLVNCQLAERHREVEAWYEVCIHFSDVILLGGRTGVANKWISDFQGKFKGQFFPCLFEFVKEGRVKNPALILEPQARRVSHYFDEADWVVIDEDEDAEDETVGDSDEEVEIVEKEDPYMERRAGGRRVKEVPDIAKFLAT